MIIGIPKEIKDHEYRVGATPELVKLLVQAGNVVLVESQAGEKSGFPDSMYEAAHAKIVHSAQEVYQAEMVLKVKEPLPPEYVLLREGQILFAFLHLAANEDLRRVIMEKKVHAVPFEDIRDAEERLPILTPMSEIAGKMSIHVGATLLEIPNKGKGVLLGGAIGVDAAQVVIIGGGVSGMHAAKTALGMGAKVTLFETKKDRLDELAHLYPHLKTLHSTPDSIHEALKNADLVIGAVLIPGKKAPKVITEKMIQSMTQGSVFVDIAIDQGGCSETSRPTTHSEPTYILHGVIHYCVTNMPGAVARTSSKALSHALTPYVLAMASKVFS